MKKNSRGVLRLEESLHLLQKRSGNYLLINDHPKNKLSLGPSKSISNLKLVQMRVSKTGCWITYSASQYGQSSRVSSSYVSINQDGLDSGRITQIFYHNYLLSVLIYLLKSLQCNQVWQWHRYVVSSITFWNNLYNVHDGYSSIPCGCMWRWQYVVFSYLQLNCVWYGHSFIPCYYL